MSGVQQKEAINQEPEPSATHEVKQTYLRKEILDLGYDADHFLEYLLDERKEGDDVDNWSLDSLEDVVQTYKGSVTIPEKENRFINESDNRVATLVDQSSEEEEGDEFGELMNKQSYSQILDNLSDSGSLNDSQLPAIEERSNTWQFLNIVKYCEKVVPHKELANSALNVEISE